VGDDKPLLSEIAGSGSSSEGVIHVVLMKISVCPDVVVLRGPTKNGKLGCFFFRSNAFDC
jgi:hypothetical protein